MNLSPNQQQPVVRPLHEPHSPIMNLATVGQKEPDEGGLITLEGEGTTPENLQKKVKDLDLQTTTGNTSDDAAT